MDRLKFIPTRFRTKSLLSWLPKAALLLLLALLSNCADNQVYPQGDLDHQILRPRTGYNGKLTNHACTKREKGECASWSVLAYDLTQKTVRDQLNQLGFVCKYGGHRYKICDQSGAPGFCHLEYHNCGWWDSVWGNCEKKTTFLPLAPYAPLVGSGLQCFSDSIYDWDAM